MKYFKVNKEADQVREPLKSGKHDILIGNELITEREAAKMLYWSTRYSPNQDKIVSDLFKEVKHFGCFEYNCYIFKGNKEYAVMSFAWNNPDGGDLFVWLQDNFQIIKILE